MAAGPSSAAPVTMAAHGMAHGTVIPLGWPQEQLSARRRSAQRPPAPTIILTPIPTTRRRRRPAATIPIRRATERRASSDFAGREASRRNSSQLHETKDQDGL